jgi:phospholipid/cholesterol/gamma-HCH transport system ATP-binding protein
MLTAENILDQKENKKYAGDKEAVIKIRNLKKSFGKNHVLRDFSMDLYKGETLAVLGKSGSGKSVLIKCIIGLLEPDEGTIEVLGKNVHDLSHSELDFMRTQVGFLFQSNALYDSMSVRENLEFPLRRHRIQLNENEVTERVTDTLKNVGLERTIDMMPEELSGGMKKRIALARTLILKPEIILYDEPTTGLDPITSKEISHLINEVQKTYDTSGIVISHDMSCVKLTSDRVVVLWEGRCYADDTYEVLERSEDKYIKQFFQ